MPSKWDERYRAHEYFYGTEPNAYLWQQTGRMTAGKPALAICDGEGRNGVWMAQQGMEVVSVDSSAAGLLKAQKLAETRNVSLKTVEADLAGWDWPEKHFNVVAAIYAHFSPHVRQHVHSAICRTMVPGGIVVLEAFSKGQLGRTSGGPKEMDMLYSPEDLSADFKELQILELLEGEVYLEEGKGHQGMGRVVRLLARKAV